MCSLELPLYTNRKCDGAAMCKTDKEVKGSMNNSPATLRQRAEPLTTPDRKAELQLTIILGVGSSVDCFLDLVWIRT